METAPELSNDPANLAKRAAKRALVLSAVVCRANIEHHAGQPEPEALHAQLLAWIGALDLWGDVETAEQKILRAPLGCLAQADVWRFAWYVEGLAILAYSLKYSTFPSLDQKVDPHVVTDSLWFLNEAALDIVEMAEVRDPVQLESARELLYAVHTRIRDFARHHNEKVFSGWIESAWLESLNLDASQLFVQNDLAVYGEAISELSAENLRGFEALIRERHRAIIWLTEDYDSYSKTPVDT